LGTNIPVAIAALLLVPAAVAESRDEHASSTVDPWPALTLTGGLAVGQRVRRGEPCHQDHRGAGREDMQRHQRCWGRRSRITKETSSTTPAAAEPRVGDEASPVAGTAEIA
jgi:hypothetical protein